MVRCPFLSIASLIRTGNWSECIGDKCACWDSDHDCCGLKQNKKQELIAEHG
jgi:hypothetical protein